VSALAFLTSWANSPFAIAIGVVGVFALLQATGLLGLLAGGGKAGHDVDHDVDADADADHDAGGDHDADHDGDGNERSLASASLAALRLGTIPLSMLKTAITSDPFDALVVTVLGGGFLFYMAEKGKNPKVKSYVDALLFLSTCLSVGYADVFAVTPAGKAIASAFMTFGPAMSGMIFDEPREDAGAGAGAAELLAVQRAIVDKLDAILGELKASRAAG
jgi:hypothetical protein